MRHLVYMSAIAQRPDCPYSYDTLRRLAKRPERYGLESVVSRPVVGGRVLWDERAWERWVRSRRVELPGEAVR